MNRFSPTKDEVRQAAAMSSIPAAGRTKEILAKAHKAAQRAAGPGVPPFAAAASDESEDGIFFFTEKDDTFPLFTSEGVWKAWMERHHPEALAAEGSEQVTPISMAQERLPQVLASMPEIHFVTIYGGHFTSIMTREMEHVSGERHDLYSE